MIIMNSNNYALYDGSVVQIISGSYPRYTIRKVGTTNVINDANCLHISLLKKGILEACGFQKEDDRPQYACTLSGQNITVFVTYSMGQMNKECKLCIYYSGDFNEEKCKYLIMLDDLQDFIRDNTSLELNVDEKALIEAVKINQYR